MDRHIRKRVSLANPIHFLALGFGSGLAPKAPGTFGTIAAIPLVCLLAYSTTLTGYVLVTLLASLIGIWLCGETAHDMMVHDDSSIVWDEIAGLLITMIAVPLNWQTLLLGFVLFRILDILKPWPISYLDARVHGGFGIMIDDILAGVFALILMHITLYLGWL
ncbi:phosphatidylglycerophosphatase A family protein [Paraglaciecola chathamensis]|uniref:phosphatidylglycerophosphatase A family protein n=1 Tax=Paraglaciecola chathamensis TaxID=368405 RepID=UPI00270D4625|nr:phosphatidylglycerophosphatase A [Paraglaciecola chathamensis]MDO6558406.1 phosphatidylglycerophosphatase A [Paraglaciecola chathamensis]